MLKSRIITGLVLAAVALSLRADIVLAFGAYIGLLQTRRALSRRWLLRTAGMVAGALVLAIALRTILLGYVFESGGGTIAYHVSTRLFRGLARTFVKNGALWVVTTNVLIVTLALVGLTRRDIRSRFGLLTLLWAGPWVVFLPFKGMDVARIAAPTIPVLVLVAIAWVTTRAWGGRGRALALTLVFSQVVAAVLYVPLRRAYPFQREIDGRVLAAVPLGFPPVDQRYRQRAAKAQERIARAVAAERSKDVVVFGHAGLMEYRFRLWAHRRVVLSGKRTRNGTVVDSMVTPENRFYFLDLDAVDGAAPLARLLSYLDGRPILVHVAPFWRGHADAGERLYLNPSQLEAALARESMGDVSMKGILDGVDPNCLSLPLVVAGSAGEAGL